MDYWSKIDKRPQTYFQKGLEEKSAPDNLIVQKSKKLLYRVGKQL